MNCCNIISLFKLDFVQSTSMYNYYTFYTYYVAFKLILITVICNNNENLWTSNEVSWNRSSNIVWQLGDKGKYSISNTMN